MQLIRSAAFKIPKQKIKKTHWMPASSIYSISLKKNLTVKKKKVNGDSY